MPDVLSQKQIDELLGSLKKGEVDIETMEEQQSSHKIKDYDFRSPKKFTREHLKLLDTIFENFARLFSLHLSSLLRVACQMEILQVEEEDFREYNNALNDSVLVGIVGMENKECGLDGKQILMEIARPLSFTILDRLLGGDGSGYRIEREYTDIELSIMEYLFHQIIPYLKNAWTNYADIEHSLDMIETNSRLIQFIPPDESVVLIVMEMTVKDLKGNVNICLSAGVMEGIIKLFNSKFYRKPKRGDMELEIKTKEEILASLKESPLTVTGILGGAQVPLRDLLELQTGDIIPLDATSKGGGVTVNVENTPWFLGSMGISKKKYAVKIDHIYK